MKKLSILFTSVFLLGLFFQSCNNEKSYAEMKEEEREAIKRFIEKEDIKVISFEQFQEQDSTTNVKDNEFVLFSDNGVYMQIVEKGNGNALKDGRYEVLARYVEEQITADGTGDTLSFYLMPEDTGTAKANTSAWDGRREKMCWNGLIFSARKTPNPRLS